jgi:hypothetical protein
MKWFKHFGLKRKLKALCPDEGFFELHSKGYGARKRRNMGAILQFFSQFGKV